MKKLIIALFVLSFASCKKEFTCDNGEVITRSDHRFNELMKGQTVTDMNGAEIRCY